MPIKKLTETTSGTEFETFNIMGNILYDIADLIKTIRVNLAFSYKGSYSSFIIVLTSMKTFQHLISSYYNMGQKDISTINLKIQIATLLERLNKIEEGTEILGDAFSRQLTILKINDVIFPKKRKSMSFVNFVKNEIS